jgi:hypothetical protein
MPNNEEQEPLWAVTYTYDTNVNAVSPSAACFAAKVNIRHNRRVVESIEVQPLNDEAAAILAQQRQEPPS